MTLIDLVKTINDIDAELVIYIKDINDLNSEIILLKTDDSNENEINVDGNLYYYLLEIFIAIEIINDWKNILNYIPSNYEIAKRLYEYAINDA